MSEHLTWHGQDVPWRDVDTLVVVRRSSASGTGVSGEGSGVQPHTLRSFAEACRSSVYVSQIDEVTLYKFRSGRWIGVKPL